MTSLGYAAILMLISIQQSAALANPTYDTGTLLETFDRNAELFSVAAENSKLELEVRKKNKKYLEEINAPQSLEGPSEVWFVNVNENDELALDPEISAVFSMEPIPVTLIHAAVFDETDILVDFLFFPEGIERPSWMISPIVTSDQIKQDDHPIHQYLGECQNKVNLEDVVIKHASLNSVSCQINSSWLLSYSANSKFSEASEE